jgi:DNA-binding IclR family transcriptional regulator
LAGHSHVDVVKTAAPFLEELSRVTGETAVLVGLSGTELLVLQSVISDQALRVCPVVGNFLSVYATAGGKILLSGMDDEGVTELLNGRMERFTPKTPTLDELLRQLNDVRSSGFATDFDEHTLGVGAAAVGLKTAQGDYAIDQQWPSAAFPLCGFRFFSSSTYVVLKLSCCRICVLICSAVDESTGASYRR